MTLPPVIRLFFAMDLPPPVKELIGQRIADLKKRARTHAIRWTKPENLHITLQFLAEVQSEHIPLLIKNVGEAVAGGKETVSFNIGRTQLFPTPYRPRVIVLEVKPQEELSWLAEVIGKGVVASQYEIERRPYRAHLSIGRIKHTHGVDLSFLSEQGSIDLPEITLNEFALFRSEPQPEGSHYTVLERIALGA